MQSTGQTSMQASQPVQLSARMTASFGKSFFFGLAAGGAAMNGPLCAGGMSSVFTISDIGRNASPTQAASSFRTGLVASMKNHNTTATAYSPAKLRKFQV